VLTNATGLFVSTHTYFGFGEEIVAARGGVDSEKMVFTGHERDFNSNAGPGDDLDYMHARYCNPNTGRFLSVDPVSGRVKMPASWNRYSYVSNNPLAFVDPDGLLQRDPDGSLKVVLGSIVGMTHAGARDQVFRVQEATLFADNGSPVQATTVLSSVAGVGDVLNKVTGTIESQPNNRNPMCTDCHGVTFADGNYWIDNDQVDTILSGDNYAAIDGGAQVGDVVIYRSEGVAVHSATVSAVNKDGSVKLVSGLGGLQVDVEQLPVEPGDGGAWPIADGVTFTIYRQAGDE